MNAATENANCLSTDSYDYHRVDVFLGDTLTLECNTTLSSEVTWSLNVTKLGPGYRQFNYIYVNGSIVDYRNFVLTYSLIHSTSLKIYNIYPDDSGFYDCYESNGQRITGYHVDAQRMLAIFVINYLLLNYNDGYSAVRLFCHRSCFDGVLYFCRRFFLVICRLLVSLNCSFIQYGRSTLNWQPVARDFSP